MNKKIVVIGSSNTDMVVKTVHFARPGETLMGSDFLINQGGKGANQAVAAARLGAPVSFVAMVGDDVFGNNAIRQFEDEQINVSHVYKSGDLATGVALITVNGEGENIIIVAPGANSALHKEHIDKAGDEIAAAELLLIQLEIPHDTVVYIAETARRYRKKLIINPAPAASLPDEVFAGLYLITPNKSEAETLTGIRIETEAGIDEAAGWFLEKGVQNVIITAGSQGSYFRSRETSFHVGACPVNVVDTTAAGDVYNGALAVALTGGKAMREAMDFASKAAAFSVTRAGAQASAPYLRDIL